MNALLRFICVFSVALFPQVLNASAIHQTSADRTSVIPLDRLAQDVLSFSAENRTSVNIGWVNIHLTDGTYAYINVTGSGTFTTTTSSQPYECTVHGQTFGQNTPTRIIIDAHTSVRATWTTNIIVFDQVETY